MANIQYTPSGVCCRQIDIETNGDVLKNVTFYGGCDGNLKCISRLVAGQNISTLIPLLQGVDCRGKGTSCSDQLARALISIQEQ